MRVFSFDLPHYPFNRSEFDVNEMICFRIRVYGDNAAPEVLDSYYRVTRPTRRRNRIAILVLTTGLSPHIPDSNFRS